MKLLLRRATVLLAFLLLLVSGLVIFAIKYIGSASRWAHYPANKHLYKNGIPISEGAIYDRSGNVLFQMSGGTVKYNKNKTIREAVMHAIGDMNGNVSTGARVVFKDKLSGWNLINGVYRFGNAAGAGRSGGGNSGANMPISGGKSMTLTIDAELCAKAYSEFKGRKGAIGIYNYKTGEILCMVSSPSFDPENPPDIESNADKYEGVYINRLLSAAYTPGSVFKLVTAAAAIDTLEGIDSRVYVCGGKLEMGGGTVTCPQAHGRVTLEQALAYSCNVAFAHIASEIGAGTLQKYADMAGFNSSLKVDGIKTAKGVVNVADAEGADLAWAGIGQYTDTANPLNFMAFMGAIANDGVSVTPRIIKDDGIFSQVAHAVKGEKRILSAETAEMLRKMMRNNVISNYGENNFKGLELCAKSGTAEVGKDVKPHSWFAGFSAREDFPVAFVVVIENGGSGSKVAGSVAAKVLQAALAMDLK